MKKSLLRGLFGDPRSSSDGEDRAKFVAKRIRLVEKHFAALGSAMSDYASASATEMDCGDGIAVALESYADDESVTTGIGKRLRDFANVLYEIGGKRNSRVRSLDAKVLRELPAYEKMCKNARKELRSAIIARDRERIRIRQLRKTREDRMADRQQISAAEEALTKARADTEASSKKLQEQMDLFERRRLSGLREILLSWTQSELRYHAKALELFTEAYNAAAKIDPEADIEEFRSRYRTENTPRLDSDRGSFYGRCESLVQLLSMPSHRSSERLTGIGIPHPSKSRSSFDFQ